MPVAWRNARDTASTTAANYSTDPTKAGNKGCAQHLVRQGFALSSAGQWRSWAYFCRILQFGRQFRTGNERGMGKINWPNAPSISRLRARISSFIAWINWHNPHPHSAVLPGSCLSEAIEHTPTRLQGKLRTPHSRARWQFYQGIPCAHRSSLNQFSKVTDFPHQPTGQVLFHARYQYIVNHLTQLNDTKSRHQIRRP